MWLSTESVAQGGSPSRSYAESSVDPGCKGDSGRQGR